MRNIFFVLLLSFPSLVFGQVAKGAGVFYFTEAPTLTPNVCYDSEIGIDTSNMGGGRNDGDSVFVTFQGQDGNFVDILGENAIEIRVYPS